MVPEGSVKRASFAPIGPAHGARSTLPPAATTRSSIAATSAQSMNGTAPWNPAGRLPRNTTEGPAGGAAATSSGPSACIGHPKTFA